MEEEEEEGEGRRRKGSSSNSSTHKQLLYAGVPKHFATLFKNIHPKHNAILK